MLQQIPFPNTLFCGDLIQSGKKFLSKYSLFDIDLKIIVDGIDAQSITKYSMDNLKM